MFYQGDTLYEKNNDVAGKVVMVVMFLLFSNIVYAASSFSVMYGSKTLKERDWKPVESQTEYGVGYEVYDSGWPVALVTAHLASKKPR